MACPGGCLGRRRTTHTYQSRDPAETDSGPVCEEMGMELRKAHENPEVIELYRTFLGSPGVTRSRELAAYTGIFPG